MYTQDMKKGMVINIALGTVFISALIFYFIPFKNEATETRRSYEQERARC